MTITITAITEKQWITIFKVALWVVGSAAVGLAIGWLTNDLLVGLPLAGIVNIVGVAVTKFFTQEETQLIDTLPADLQKPVEQGAAEIKTEVSTIKIPVVTPIAQDLTGSGADKSTLTTSPVTSSSTYGGNDSGPTQETPDAS